ncbi:MAG: hypothetical protein ACRDHL_11640 [Candidatus Promineifilaceae bacterium]
MAEAAGKSDVYLEIGQKRAFAAAVEWPGWCRAGRDEAAALEALLQYGPRYARVLRPADLGFEPPADVSAFSVVERLEGNATTDFGAPGMIPASDGRPVGAKELARFKAILEACWQAFDAAARAAAGVELRKGPRGGGRELEAISEHVVGADLGYLRALGWKLEKDGADGSALERTRQAILDGLAAAAAGEIAAEGPRGGARWPARYFVRRVAWHVLDHAWETEDRSQ